MLRNSQHRTRFLTSMVVTVVVFLTVFGYSVVRLGPIGGAASAESYVPVSGAGSTWSANALNQWIADVDQYGMRVNYAPTGSSDGRHQFLSGTVDFAASDIPFQTHPEDGSPPEQPTNFAYMPITAGGTVFMYNLNINGRRVTNLRLSGENVSKIFTGTIKSWNDPAIAADNPGLTLPNKAVVPVVRSDGSGSTAQFTLWMINQYPSIWNDYCHRSGRAPKCGSTSYYPTVGNMIAQSGDLGVAGYVAQNYADGAIGYVNYSYALNAKFPVAKLLNSAGYYTEPTPENVAVSLLKAQVETANTDPQYYLTQKLDGVYNDPDPRTYPLSSYSYLILPTKVQGQFTPTKGKTLAAFSYYAMCQGQQESASLGYSPMPVNLVQASFDQIRKIPGAVVQNIDIQSCKNPTFAPGRPNLLADTAPMPPACDKKGAPPCGGGTGGTRGTTSPAGGSRPGAGGPSAGGGGAAGGGAAGTGGGGTAGSGSAAAGRTGGTAATRGRSGTGRAGGGAGGSSDLAASASPTDAAGGGAAGAAQQCDASTGGCTSSAAVGNGAAADGTSSGGQGPLLASPTTLAAAHGWTSTETLMVLMTLFVLVLVLAPGVLARVLDARVL